MPKKIVYCLFLDFILTSWSIYAQELPVINSIEIKGLKRIEESAVKSKITQKVRRPNLPGKNQ